MTLIDAGQLGFYVALVDDRLRRVQQLTLMMAIPPLLVLGSPGTLVGDKKHPYRRTVDVRT